MKKIIIIVCIVVAVAISASLGVVVYNAINGDDTTSADNIVTAGYEYSYYLRKALSYRAGCRVQKEIELTDDGVNIEYSHGFRGPWDDGGYVYPDVDTVKLAVKNDAGETVYLGEWEYFEYIDSYYYSVGINYSAMTRLSQSGIKWYSYEDEEGMRYKENEDGTVGGVVPNVYYNNRETVTLQADFFPSEEGHIVFEIHDLYSDGRVYVTKMTYLYYNKADGVLTFSASDE